MHSKGVHLLGRRLSFLLLLLVTVLLAGALMAGDYEDPSLPTSGGEMGGEIGFGAQTVIADDTGGSPIDAREAIEPQLTSLLTMEDVDDSQSDSIVITTQPTFELWTESASINTE